MKAILSGEGRTLVCLILCLAGPFTAGPSSDLLGERDLAARLALVAPTPIPSQPSAIDAHLQEERGLAEARQLEDERPRLMSFFEAIAGNDRDTLCKMLNKGMDPNVELPVPVPVAFQKRFTDENLRYHVTSSFCGCPAAKDPPRSEIMQSLMRIFRITIKLTEQKALYAVNHTLAAEGTHTAQPKGVLQAPYRGGNGTRVPHACGHDAQAALAGELTPGDGIRPGMLSFPEACGYSWRWRSACNMRKGFEGLSALVGTVL